MKELLGDGESRMQKSVESTRHDLQTIRTGRANPGILDRVQVSYYGSDLPLSQVATITAPEPRMLVISPWDKKALGPIEKAIMKSDLGLTPNNDGIVIRLIIPTLTEETRRNLIRNVHKRIEEGKVAIRNIRRDVIEDLRSLKKEGEIGEDEEKRTEAEVQKMTDRHIHDLDVMQKKKEEELLEV
ncbi:MAG: ribosome recycling factor [Armatimonadetes bacterium]|nr:ribosome recycling factor [Armatimonadota bacterium]